MPIPEAWPDIAKRGFLQLVGLARYAILEVSAGFAEGPFQARRSALIRGLDVLLQQETGLPIHLDEDPMTCVVRGVGRILDDPEKYRTVLST